MKEYKYAIPQRIKMKLNILCTFGQKTKNLIGQKNRVVASWTPLKQFIFSVEPSTTSQWRMSPCRLNPFLHSSKKQKHLPFSILASDCVQMTFITMKTKTTTIETILTTKNYFTFFVQDWKPKLESVACKDFNLTGTI